MARLSTVFFGIFLCVASADESQCDADTCDRTTLLQVQADVKQHRNEEAVVPPANGHGPPSSQPAAGYATPALASAAYPSAAYPSAAYPSAAYPSAAYGPPPSYPYAMPPMQPLAPLQPLIPAYGAPPAMAPPAPAPVASSGYSDSVANSGLPVATAAPPAPPTTAVSSTTAAKTTTVTTAAAALMQAARDQYPPTYGAQPMQYQQPAYSPYSAEPAQPMITETENEDESEHVTMNEPAPMFPPAGGAVTAEQAAANAPVATAAPVSATVASKTTSTATAAM